jgi:hypothetical protein
MRQRMAMMALYVILGLNALAPVAVQGQGPQRRWWMKPRLHLYWDRVLHGEQWIESDWLENLRMSRQTFLMICERLRSQIERYDTRLRRSVPVTERVAITLWKLATVVEYRTLREEFGVGRSTICEIVHDTCRAICVRLQVQICGHFCGICWPGT